MAGKTTQFFIIIIVIIILLDAHITSHEIEISYMHMIALQYIYFLKNNTHQIEYECGK